MKDKILFGIIIILILALCVETARILQLHSERILKPRISTLHNSGDLFGRSYKRNFIIEDDLQNNINKILENNFNDIYTKRFSFSFGNENIQETEKEYVIKMDLPDMENKKINVQIEGDSLIVSGESNTNKEEKQGKMFSKSEHSFSTFRKVIPLPGEVDPANVKTEYKDGVLIITLPKTGCGIKDRNDIKV